MKQPERWVTIEDCEWKQEFIWSLVMRNYYIVIPDDCSLQWNFTGMSVVEFDLQYDEHVGPNDIEVRCVKVHFTEAERIQWPTVFGANAGMPFVSRAYAQWSIPGTRPILGLPRMK